MYQEHFGLKENPFSIAPDPRYFFLSEGHREAVAHLIYGVNSDGGFILLTGEIGTGKTTTFRYLLDRLPENAEIAFVLNPRLKAEELLETICKEFGIPLPETRQSIGVAVSAIYDYLLKNGIPAERMTYKGYKNTQMLFPNPKNEKEAEQNRRVEIILGKIPTMEGIDRKP